MVVVVMDSFSLKHFLTPRLVWLRLSAGLKTQGSLVRFPGRAHAWVVGQVTSARGNHTLMFISLFFSLLPLSLKINKILNIKDDSSVGYAATYVEIHMHVC